MSTPARGYPRHALALDYVLGLAILIPLRSWQQLVAVLGVLYMIDYAFTAVAAGVFRASVPGRLSGVVRGMGWVTSAGFVVCTEIVYWSTWHTLRTALPLALLGIPLFLAQHGRPRLAEFTAGLCAPLHFAVLLLLSSLGDFGGSGRSLLAARGDKGTGRVLLGYARRCPPRPQDGRPVCRGQSRGVRRPNQHRCDRRGACVRSVADKS